MRTQFTHAAEDRDAAAAAGKAAEGFESCLHGIGIRIVGIIKELEARGGAQLDPASRQFKAGKSVRDGIG